MPKASRQSYSYKAYYRLVLPAVLILLLVNTFPLIYSCYISVTNYSLSDPDTSSFEGFNNFVQAFKDPYEAAELDGASGFQKFLHIAFPAMRNTMWICILIRGMDAFREYDKVYTMTYAVRTVRRNRRVFTSIARDSSFLIPAFRRHFL
jgi:ABC-type sugar transport system permease subunit